MKRLTIVTEIIAPYRIPVFNALAARGVVRPHVIFLAENDQTQRQWRVERERIQFSFEVLPHRRWRMGATMLLLNRGVRSALRQARPDVVLAGGYNYPACWKAQRWAQKAGVPFALWSESNRDDARAGGWLRELAKRRFVAACDGFLVPGKSAAEYLMSYGVARERITIAPNAVDNERFSTLAAQARAKADAMRAQLGLPARYFLYAGRLVREKGIFDLLAAYIAMPEPLRHAVGLVFVGDGPQREELLAAARTTAGVLWKGFAQQEELPAYYALAEALVLPTWSDPWGLVVNEAMACGTPAIVSQVAGCAADLVVESGRARTGWVVPPRDRDRLRVTMEELAIQPMLCRAAGVEAARHIEQYSPQRCAAGMEQLADAIAR